MFRKALQIGKEVCINKKHWIPAHSGVGICQVNVEQVADVAARAIYNHLQLSKTHQGRHDGNCLFIA